MLQSNFFKPSSKFDKGDKIVEELADQNTLNNTNPTSLSFPMNIPMGEGCIEEPTSSVTQLPSRFDKGCRM